MRPIDKLDDTIKDLTAYISGLSENQLELSKTEKWGAREVFIHIVFWHEQYASITKDLVRNKKPQLLSRSWIAHNALAVEQNKDIPIKSLIERLQEAQSELLTSYDNAETLRIAFREGEKIKSYPVAIERIEQHIRSHLERLKARYH